eukprot:4256175-Alexandrium_andersonii.AAC.1
MGDARPGVAGADAGCAALGSLRGNEPVLARPLARAAPRTRQLDVARRLPCRRIPVRAAAVGRLALGDVLEVDDLVHAGR